MLVLLICTLTPWTLAAQLWCGFMHTEPCISLDTIGPWYSGNYIYPKCNCHNTTTTVYIRGRQWSILYKGGAFDVSASHSTIMYIFMNNAGPNTVWQGLRGHCGSQTFQALREILQLISCEVYVAWIRSIIIINMIMTPKICIIIIVFHYHCKYLVSPTIWWNR